MPSNRDKAEIIAELSRIIDASPPSEVSGAGRPVVAYFSTYVPVEILLAAGLYPFRFRGLGVESTSSADVYLSHLTCSFARHVTTAMIDGVYQFLDGYIGVNVCDHVRRAYDVLETKVGDKFHAFVSVPRSFRESLFPWYLEELERLKTAIEEHFKVQITDQALRKAIQDMEQVRDRISRLDALRGADAPQLSGTELLIAAVAARTLLPERFVKIADELIAAAEVSEPVSGIRARVILIGGQLDEPRFVMTIESQAAAVVGDLLCFGTRGVGESVAQGDSPMLALARAYMYQHPCARMMGEFERRYNAITELYKQRHAQGIIFQSFKFCQIWATEIHNLRHRFESEPLPLLVLEREYGTVSTGQIKTRVQAFVERLGG